MDVPELIAELKAADRPHRRLDTEIARAVGYQKMASLDSQHQGRLVWYGPDGHRLDPPFFTSNLDAARELSGMLAPGYAIAVSWGERPSAAIGDLQARTVAANAAMALCIAALQAARLTIDGNLQYVFPPEYMKRS